MAPSIESVDNLPKPPPRDRVNKTDRNKEEQDRELFKKTLKRKMQPRAEDDEPEGSTDALILEGDGGRQPRSDTNEDAGSTEEQTVDVIDDEGEDDPEGTIDSDHIDLKA